MSISKPNYARLLFTGVKRKKEAKSPISAPSQELLIRQLPPIVEDNNSSSDQSEDEQEEATGSGVKLFSSDSAANEALKSQIERKRRDKATEKRLAYIAEVRRLNKIFTWGEGVEDPFIEFADLSLPPSVLRSLDEFGIVEPTPIQMQAVPLMVARKNLLASAPTGSGKTLAYVLPLIQHAAANSKPRGPLAIVLEPTRVLAKQVHVQFVKFAQGLSFGVRFYDDGDFPEDAAIIITTPNRLFEAVNANPSPMQKLLGQISWLVVDEADRFFGPGENERGLAARLTQIMSWTPGADTRKAFFSATLSGDVEAWCKVWLPDTVMLCIGARNAANALVSQKLVFAGSESGKVSGVRGVLQAGFEPPALVFVQDKDRAGELYAELTSAFPSMPIAMLTSEVTDSQKDAVLDRVRARTVFVLICTEIIGRGIDLPTVNLVINFDLPTSIISYIHRIGRTGRAGKPGCAITYFTESDMKYVRSIATVIHQAGFDVPPYTLQLDKPTKAQKKQVQKQGIERKRFGGVREWARLKDIKKQRNELLVIDPKKKRLLTDNDTGADVVTRRAFVPGKKNAKAKKNKGKLNGVKKSKNAPSKSKKKAKKQK